MSLVIAHRGASYAAPENTLAAVRLAWEMGADGVEIDVHLSADGQLAVMHDRTTLRTTGVDRAVAETPMAELATLNAGWHKGGKFTREPEPIPTLPQVLALVPPGKRIFIEVKEPDRERMLPVLQADLAAAALEPALVTVMSFDFELVALVRREIPGIDGLWIYGDYSLVAPEGWGEFSQFLIQQALSGLCTGLNLGQHDPRVNAELIREIHAAGLTANFWTVDSPGKMRELLAGGADAVTTNLPDWALALRERVP